MQSKPEDGVVSQVRKTFRAIDVGDGSAALRPFFSGCTQAGSNGRLLRNYDFARTNAKPPSSAPSSCARSSACKKSAGGCWTA